MNEFIYRLILSALSLMLFYSIYRLLLNRLTLLNAGRAYLVITMLMALFIPLPWQRLIESPAEIAFVVNLDVTTIIPYTVQTESTGTFNWWNLAFYVYLIPLAFFSLFFLYSNLRLLFALRLGQRVHRRIILMEQDVLPFSWFGRIVMSRKDYESQHAHSIIAHELTHIRQYHFIDLLLAELLIVLQWFNPVAWAYRSAVRDMHEYLADKGTINSGYALTEYQRLLATLAGPVTAGILSNNIKHSTLKNRFTMMTTTNNSNPAAFRLAIAIVAVMLIGFSVFISACQTGSKKAETETAEREIIDIPLDQITIEKPSGILNPEDEYVEIQRGDSIHRVKAFDANSGAFILVQDPPVFPGGDEARIEFIRSNIKYPEEAREKGIQGTVFVNFVIESDGSVSNIRVLRGIGSGCDEEAVRVVENMPRWIPGKQKGEAVRVQFNMPIRFVLE